MVSALHKFATYLFRHLCAYLQPRGANQPITVPFIVVVKMKTVENTTVSSVTNICSYLVTTTTTTTSV